MTSNTIRNVLIVIFVLILGYVGYFIFSGRQLTISPKTPTPTPEIVDLQDSLTVVTASINEKNETNDWEVTAEYPQIAGLKDNSVLKKINDDIKAVVKRAVDDFKLAENDNTVEVGISEGKSSFDIKYRSIVGAPNSNIISFSIVEGYYFATAAHPSATIVSLNYDLKTGNRLGLQDLFTGNYLGVLSTQSRAMLKAKLGESSDVRTLDAGTSAKEENFKVFFPTKDGLQIIFNEYQVASGAAGSQEILIPYSKLKAVINPNGPLKNL